MTVREYIGARYVPLFMGDWDIDADYEPLSIVQYQGNSYTSRQSVPHGTEITNKQYWAETGNYNAQVEAYRQEVLAFDGRIDNLEGKFPITTSDVSDNAITTSKIVDESVTADKLAENSVDSSKVEDGSLAFGDMDTTFQNRITGIETDIVNINEEIKNIDVEIVNSKNLEGYALAKYEVFTDLSAYAAADTANVWDYFKEIFNEQDLNMNVNTAPENTGWVRTNAAGQNARAYLVNVAENQASEYRYSVQYVILNFGFYDIIGNQSGNYEVEGRNVVNAASNYYPNAIVIVNPCSNNYCYGYGRSFQLHMYQLNYGMVRSQVPIKIIPWYIAFNVNQLAINHYYDTSSTNPTLLNSGGTNSIGAMLKATLFGCENGYERGTRAGIDNFLDSNYFKASNSELSYNVETQHVELTAGALTAKQDITVHNTKVGEITNSTFTVSEDTILCLLIQNTQNNPVKGYLVLGADNGIYVRFPDNSTTISNGAILRMLSTGTYMPAFKKI